MRKLFVTIAFVAGTSFLMPAKISAQCPNLNFSSGTLEHWQCYIGSCASGTAVVNPSAPIYGRHTVMDAGELMKSGQFFDENCSAISKVPDGHNYSCRLGNSGGGADATAIAYEITVDSNSSLLLLSYAYVMGASNHAPADMPQFTIKITDSAGRILPVPCAYVNFVSDAGLAGLACNTSSVVAKNWTTVGISLESVMGRKIKVYFETRGCTQGGHFGYAYVVAECRPMRIDLMYCEGQAAARLRAPEGFQSYTWTRSHISNWRNYDRRINIQNPNDGEIFTCTVKSELDCETELETVIAKTQIDANFYFGVIEDGNVPLRTHNWVSWYDTCSRTATFVERASVFNSKKSSIEWEIHGLPNVHCYDSLFTFTFPDPVKDTPVEYAVRLTVWAENGCVDTSHSEWRLITIYPSSKVKITGTTQLCTGKKAYLIATTVRSKFLSHTWSGRKEDGTPVTHTGDTLEIDRPGTYYLSSLDTNWCYAFDTLIVTSLKPAYENLRVKPVKCFGDFTGSFSYDALMIGGLPPYQSVEWTVWKNGNLDVVDISETPNAGMVFEDLPAGTCTFHAVDAEGCDIRDTIRILQPDLLGVTAYSAVFCPGEAYTDGNFTNLTEPDVYYVTLKSVNKCDSIVCLTLTHRTIPLTYYCACFCPGEFYTDNNFKDLAESGVYYDTLQSVKGCDSIVCLTLAAECDAGVRPFTKEGTNIRIYPNPTNGHLIIDHGGLAIETIEIYDIVGRVVETRYATSLRDGAVSMDISHLANGMYFVTLTTETGKTVRKIIKE